MALKVTTVERNGETITFNPVEATKGLSKGNIILTPKPITTMEELMTYLKWAGESESIQFFNAFFRANSLGWSQEAEEESALEKATDDKGNERVVKVDEELYTKKFIELATEFSARGETIKQIQERIDEKLAELSALTEDTSDDAPLRMVAVAKELKKLQAAKAAKRRKRSDDEADEKNGN